MSIKLEFIETGQRINCTNYRQAKAKKDFWSGQGKNVKIVIIHKDTRFMEGTGKK